VPLELNTIPAPKEFKDAIQSLSPEQRAFAQAYRAMQLESTLFGVLVIQIKPPMERLLGLPEGALSQELKLTQDLMELFITYQIPSDLLVYSGDPAAPPEYKVEAVRHNVTAMQNVFKEGIRAEVEEAIMQGKIELEEEKEKSRERIRVEKQHCEQQIARTQQECQSQIEATRRRCRNEESAIQRSVDDARRRAERQMQQAQKENERKLKWMQLEAELARAERKLELHVQLNSTDDQKAQWTELQKKFEAETAEIEAIPAETPEAELEKVKKLKELVDKHELRKQAFKAAEITQQKELEMHTMEVHKCKAEIEMMKALEAEEERRRIEEEEMKRCLAMEEECRGYAEERCMSRCMDMDMCYAEAAEMACMEEARCLAAESCALSGAAAPMRARAAKRAAPQQKAVKKGDDKDARETPAQNASAAAEDVDVVDYTKIPKELDRRFEELDEGGCLRPTIINPGETWTKKSQEHLLAKQTTRHLSGDALKSEKDKAFDLLSALSRSGAMIIDHATLHVMVAATHCFDKTVIDTVVQDNVNPIDKAERSTLIMATTIHKRPAGELLQQSQLPRIQSASPMLFN